MQISDLEFLLALPTELWFPLIHWVSENGLPPATSAIPGNLLEIQILTYRILFQEAFPMMMVMVPIVLKLRKTLFLSI